MQRITRTLFTFFQLLKGQTVLKNTLQKYLRECRPHRSSPRLNYITGCTGTGPKLTVF